MNKTRRLSRLPGDPTDEEVVARIVRVDQAGEYGAKRIYEGQLAVLGGTSDEPVLREMAAAEEQHLAIFDRMIAQRRIRPTALQPFWHVAGFALGMGTALMGREAAMACTVAVEEVIEDHYTAQSERLPSAERELRVTIEKIRDEETAHKETAAAHGAHDAVAYPALTAAVKTGSRLAIWLSERI